MKSKKILLPAAVVLTALFILGIVRLFALRFETGDMYPPYSSLRSDPLGSRALYEGLVNMDLFSIERNYLPLSQRTFKKQTTLVFLGADALSPNLSHKDFTEAVDRLTTGRGRLLLAFNPVRGPFSEGCGNMSGRGSEALTGKAPRLKAGHGTRPSRQSSADRFDCLNAAGKDAAVPEAESSLPACPPMALSEDWGACLKLDNDTPFQDQASLAVGGVQANLPQGINWHSRLYFDELQPPWRVIYRRAGNPVIIERPYRAGMLVLVADSYLFSNEALWSERQTGLLTRLLGSNLNLVFDETHFGIFKAPGVVDLIKAYRLQGFFITIAFLFLLFVWKNSLHFVPPREPQDGDCGNYFDTARDQTQGLIGLLRRNIPARRVLAVCLDEWRKSARVVGGHPAEILERYAQLPELKTVASEHRDSPVSGYRIIGQLISKGRSK